jgi:hypothetical protein
LNDSESILRALLELHGILEAGGYPKAASEIGSLRSLGASSLDAQRSEFARTITTDKYFWGGMGTIADLVMPTPQLEVRFASAYLELAKACELAGLGPIYSKSIRRDFPGLLKYWRKRLAQEDG